jgi:hypothetical protein
LADEGADKSLDRLPGDDPVRAIALCLRQYLIEAEVPEQKMRRSGRNQTVVS